MKDKDNELRGKINNNSTLLKLARQKSPVSEAASVKGLLGAIMGSLKSVGLEDEQALTYINAELKAHGGGAKAVDSSGELAKKIDSLESDKDLTRSDTQDDYEYDPNQGLVVKKDPQAQKNVEHGQHGPDDQNTTSGMLGP